MRRVNLRHFRILFCIVAFGLTGCMLGPDFHKPPPPPVFTYTGRPEPKKTISIPKAGQAGKPQYFEMGMDLPADWWRLFHSPEINCLVKLGLANSPTLTSAMATLRQARENWLAQIGMSLFPNVAVQLGGQRQLFNNNTFDRPGASVFSLYNAAINVTYTLDVFGALRRQIESLGAQIDYQSFQVQAAYLTLTSNIVTTAFTIASLREQIRVTRELVNLQRNLLSISQKQFRYGGIAGINVLQQQSELALTLAKLPALQQSLAKAEHSLSVLIGRFPNENEIPKLNLHRMNLPAHLPVSLPACLVRQRPDVRASEALLHSAMAQVGVATANLFPQFNLTGNYGWQDFAPSGLFSPASLYWNYGATLLQPVFQAGALHAKRRAALAACQAASAQYRQTVLQAFQNVADTLRALQHDAQNLKAYKDAEIFARQSYNIVQQQYKQGGVSYVALITAENQYQQAIISRVQAEAARYTDTAALFQALGGGWWNRGRCIVVRKCKA